MAGSNLVSVGSEEALCVTFIPEEAVVQRLDCLLNVRIREDDHGVVTTLQAKDGK
jgi:hypothetical protein